ncbi:hypothetical protein B0J12DRAFT_733631 [Macrophomina phaseolina]|uniref:Uncharacterized protein n=1 Tax=Macrophomina phaseolina TaxID=35725 RepID=A0ABQ8FQU4_9PEZI|nr:hypothetical protein B0J12DRAFT_733631 [Macrophomina phaseolina]
MFSKAAILAGVVSLASMASAGVVSFEIPKTIVPGATFTAHLTDNNATKAKDISIAFGISPGSGYPTSWGLGRDLLGKALLTNTDITPTPENIPVDLTVPDYMEKGDATVVAVVHSLLGAGLNPISTLINATVAVGDEVSTETVESGERLTIQHQF